MMKTSDKNTKSALIVVDMQNDFMEGGSLAVKDSLLLIPVINRLLEKFSPDQIFFTKDWHPSNHRSFMLNNPGSELYKPFLINETGQSLVMWPVHCIQGTEGSEIHSSIKKVEGSTIVNKGTKELYECYSGFGTENEETNLKGELIRRGITHCFVCGLALDYCVGNTAIDARKNGFEVTLITDATKGVFAESSEQMMKTLKELGCKFTVEKGTEA